jgi:putative DNA primase/helicase
MYSNNTSNSRLVTASNENPCPHCGKPDWCYFIGDLSACKRQSPPASGWEVTSKTDQDGTPYYAPIQEKKAIRPAQTRRWEYPARDSSKLVRVKRIDFGDGRKKDFKQEHWDGKRWVLGLGKVDRADIPVYRYAEVKKAIAKNDLIFIVEGEPCADALWALGLAATCNIGGSKKWRSSDTSDLEGASVVIVPDRDVPGIEFATKLSKEFPDAQWLYPYPDSYAWKNPPKSDGLDVADWIESEKLDAKTLLNSLLSRAHTREDVVRLSSDGITGDYIPDTAPSPELNYVQKAESALYSDGHWVSIAGQLYQFADGYYQLRSESSEKRRIRDWLSTYFENVKGVYRCNRASSGSVNQVYDWTVLGLAVDLDTVNPPGLNCSNGVLRINLDGSHSFTPHSPEQVYTYIGGKYDPDIDPADCDRLLECLEPQQREIFIRTIAAALCLPLARLKMSRVKGLLCHGDGSNGKDTLRTVLVAVLGRGVTGKSLKDFQVYDTGRKFPLAGLENSLCNWSSENADAVKLDKLQSLKQFITGDELTIEHKGRGEYPYKPEAIFLANCNVLPSISSDAEAIRSRYCILSFKKTYAVKANAAKGELEADPRFKEDPNFVLERIAPALLNRMLERIPLLLAQGINYGSSDAALREAQEKSQHLWQFVRDLGYEVGQGERVYAKDLWQELRDWYVEAGILEIEYNGDKEKLIWNELPGRDTPVKAINQLFARFSELFPKLEKYRHTERGLESERAMGETYYLGIRKQKLEKKGKSSSASSAPDSTVVLSSALLQQKVSAEDGAEATILTQRAAEDAEDEKSPFSEICTLLPKLTDDERRQLVEILTQPQPAAPAAQELRSQNTQPEPSPENKSVTPEDAEKLRDIALIWWDEYYPEQLQSLDTQMFGWNAPGKKYDLAAIADWLEAENELVQQRITELIHRRERS